jgi:CubicO group peptidase (beta-lactamase class C family)
MPRKKRSFRFLFIAVLIIPLLLTCREQGLDAYKPDVAGPVFLNDPADMDRKAAAIDSLVRHKFVRQGFNGVLLVAHRGQILFEGAVGNRGKDPRQPLETTDLFELASVSKQFTAVAILQLVAQGKLSLDDELQRFFPFFPHQGITIHHLLSHRGGLSNYMYDFDRLWPDHSQYPNNQQLVEVLSTQPQPPFYPPNKRFDYSNTGYALLASVVEQVSGMAFSDYLQAHVFEPAGMQRARLIQPQKPLPKNAVSGHTGYYRPVTTQYYLNAIAGDKGIYASVRDLYAWEKALFEHKVLDPASMALALQPHSVYNRKGYAYGYGWRMYQLPEGRTIYYHGGWWRGFKTLLVHLPDDHSCIIALSNKTSGALIDKAAILGILYGGEAANDVEE